MIFLVGGGGNGIDAGRRRALLVLGGQGGDEMFGPAGTRLSVYAFSLYEVKDGKFVRAIAWTGRRPQSTSELVIE